MKVRTRLKGKILKQLGQKVRQLRMQQGYTQEGFAELVGIDPSYVGGIEIGRRSPSLYCLYVIATALKVKLSDIVDFEVQ